jgi:signal transduction histidine kinase
MSTEDWDGKDAAPEVRRLRRLLEASRLLNSTLELPELTEIVLSFLQDELPIERCTLFVVDRRQKLLRSLVAQGIEQFEIVLAFGEGLAGTVARTGEPLDVEDAYTDERFHPGFDRRFNFRTKDVLCLPVFNREESLVGVLQLLNRRRPLTRDEHEFLVNMCTYIGIAMHNAWLHREVRESKSAEHELRLVREKLAQVDKQSALNEFVAGVVHEIRNPLAVAQSQCDLFRKEEPLAPSAESRLEKIESSITKALTIAQNFLQVARQSNTLQTTDVNSVISRSVDLMVHEFHSRAVSVTLDLETLPFISADSDNLQQVLLNVLKNALDAACEREDAASVSVRSTYHRHNHSIRIEISDNGPGIPEELQARIFEPFFSTKPAGIGSGLGLSVSKRIVEQHQGKLSFDSAPGLGTTFSIELPVQQAPRGMTVGE